MRSDFSKIRYDNEVSRVPRARTVPTKIQPITVSERDDSAKTVPTRIVPIQISTKIIPIKITPVETLNVLSPDILLPKPIPLIQTSKLFTLTEKNGHLGTYDCLPPQFTHAAKFVSTNYIMSCRMILNLSTQAVFTAAYIFDAFLERKALEEDDLHLITPACIILSSKMEDRKSARDCLLHFEKSRIRTKILEIEKLIILTLTASFRFLTPWKALEHYIDVITNEKQLRYCQYVLECSLFDVRMNKYYPSLIASSAVYLSRLLKIGIDPLTEISPWNKDLKAIFSHTSINVWRCSSDLKKVIAKVERSRSGFLNGWKDTTFLKFPIDNIKSSPKEIAANTQKVYSRTEPKSFIKILDKTDFEIKETSGNGGEGRVYGCRYKEENKYVAIKEFNFDESNNGINRNSLREISILSNLCIDLTKTISEESKRNTDEEKSCPGIISILGIFLSYDNKECLGTPKLCMVMEYMDVDLKRFLMIESRPDKIKFDICIQITRAIHFMHCRGIIHADIKPSNVLVKENKNEGLIIKVSDFGRSRESSNRKCSIGRLSTLIYTAPEILLEVE